MHGFRGWEVEFLLKLMCFNHELVGDQPGMYGVIMTKVCKGQPTSFALNMI
jgi:hypothetical protein